MLFPLISFSFYIYCVKAPEQVKAMNDLGQNISLSLTTTKIKYFLCRNTEQKVEEVP